MTKKKIEIRALRITQPIGEFFIGSIRAKDLVEISWVDVRRMANEAGEIDRYIGIQRRISPTRVEKLREYVKTVDATFPTSIIVAVSEQCAEFFEDKGLLVLSEHFDEESPSNSIDFGNIAKILDGQHRIRAFARPDGQRFLFDSGADENFELCVSFFVGADLPTQATIFSIVNLAQTKVNKSLVYDLYSLATTRSPQKSAHFIAVALDSREGSPLHGAIKRLGTATPGREPGTETITQATFVESLVPYLSDDPVRDRDYYLQQPDGAPPLVWSRRSDAPLFRRAFLEKNEGQIAKVLWGYFEAVARRWPEAWQDAKKGVILKRTNGFRALMSVFGDFYLAALNGRESGDYIPAETYANLFARVPLDTTEITTERFPPGSSGESALKRALRMALPAGDGER